MQSASSEQSVSPEIHDLINEINKMGNEAKIEIMKKLVANKISSNEEAILAKQALRNLSKELLKISKSSPLMQEKLREVFSKNNSTGTNSPSSVNDRQGNVEERDSRLVVIGQSDSRNSYSNNNYEGMAQSNQKRSYAELTQSYADNRSGQPNYGRSDVYKPSNSYSTAGDVSNASYPRDAYDYSGQRFYQN